jgi:hypothetical protein
VDTVNILQSRVGADLCVRPDLVGFCAIMICFIVCSGCASTQPSVKQSDSFATQMDAAKKVVGAMAPDKGAVEKYSPVTGKHYSGALEYEPGTGAKLVPIE